MNLTKQNSADGNTTDSPRLLRAAEAARMVAISTRTLWRLVSSGNFPDPVHVGGSTRWRLTDIERWIERGCTGNGNDPE